MVIHNQKLNKIILALRRGLIKVNLLYDPDLFLNNHLSGFRPRRSGVPFSKNYIKLSRLVRFVGITTSVTLVLLTLAATFPIVNHQNDAEATYVPATTTLSIVSSKDTASVDITPTSSTGTFATSAAADMAEFTVTTDNLTGYSVTLLGSDASGQLVNDTTGDTLDSITADTTESDFRTGSASTYNNKWGYRLNINNTTTTNFLSAPTSTTVAKTIYSTTRPNTTGTSDSFTLGLGARIDYTKPTGTYTNTFVLTAVANNITYAINYLDNTGPGGTTGSDVSDLPAAEGSSNITASSFTLSTTEPQRTGYDFIGWCDGTVTHVASGTDTCTGTTYQAGDTYTFTSISSTSTNTANLYAMWKKGAEALQNWTGCSAMSVGDTVTLIDSRDNEQYLVGKLADGNCWTLENLRLDISDATVQTKLDSITTNATDITLGYLKNGGGSGQYPANGVIAKTASGGSWTNDYANPYIATQYENTTQAASGSAPAGTIGIYYNYCAASAGSYCYAANASSGDASQDICPAGWHLPTGGASGQYQALYTAYSSNVANFEAALSTPLSGYFYSGTASYQGSYGYFWSSTRYNGNSMYGLYVDASTVYPQDNYYRYGRLYGFSVRCISALDGTMQGFTATDKAAMSTGDTRTLIDTRDGKTYTVGKLADGNVWMKENLRLDISDATVQAKLNSTTTNATDTSLTYLKNGGGSSPYPANGVIARSASGGSWSNDYANPYIATSGTDSGGWTNDTIIAASGSAPAGKIGIYYNFCAASAGSYCYAANASSGDASEDICPAGWKMPTGGASGQYQALYAAYSSNVTNFETALNTPLSGYFYAGAATSWGVGGNFWASTRYNGYYMHYMDVYSSTVRPQQYYDRYYGFSVRCVFGS